MDDRVYNSNQVTQEKDGNPITSAHQAVTTMVTILVLFASAASIWVIRKCNVFPANKLFLMSLVIADFVQATVILPLSVTAAMLGGWSLPPIVWLVQVAISNILWFVSIYCLALTNIDHYVAVTEPAHYLQQFGNHKSACWVIFIWTIGAAFTIPIAIMGAQKSVICSNDLMFCLINHDILATYSSTCIILLLPLPIFLLIATSRRGLAPKVEDHTTVSDQRLDMYKANTISSLVTIALWIIGLCGTFSKGAPSILRLIFFWIGLSAPLVRTLCYGLFAKATVKTAYTKSMS